MSSLEYGREQNRIRSMIGNHFESLRWTSATESDWGMFVADFLKDVLLFPAARPAKAKTLNEFIERMNNVSQGSLRDLEERTTGMRILAFGNVGVVLAASEMLENKKDVNHDVSAHLLVKTDGEWKIAAHAWDHANDIGDVQSAGFLSV
jgi:ketosteroid isomerase-like protein